MSNKTIFYFVIFVISSQFLFSQQKLAIWENFAPGTEGRENQEEWGVENKLVRNVFQPDISVYLPSEAEKPTTAILVCPEGGYRQVEMRKEGYRLAEWLSKNNIAAFVLKYRLDPQEALQDANRAMSFIRSKADEFNIDPDKLGVMGFSAGAHLTFNLSMNNVEKDYFDSIDSIYSKPNFFIGVYGGYVNLIDLSLESIEKTTEQDNPGLPPTFLVHVGNDSRVPVERSVNLYLKLKKMGVPAELHVYEYGEHGFAIETNRGDNVTSTVNSWKARLWEWLRINNF